jgi:transposase
MIRELYQKGWTQTAIGKETGFDRKTIRKYLKGDKLPERKANGKQKASKLDPYKNYLLQRIQEGTTNCVVLFEEIQAMGYRQDDDIKRFCSTVSRTAKETSHLAV